MIINQRIARRNKIGGTVFCTTCWHVMVGRPASGRAFTIVDVVDSVIVVGEDVNVWKKPLFAPAAAPVIEMPAPFSKRQ